MWGTLHVIPPSDELVSQKLLGHASKHRLVVLTEPPELHTFQLAVGGEIAVVEDFETILHGGEEVPCKVLIRKDAARLELATNAWANLLWLQHLVRKNGFAETKPPHAIHGHAVIAWGDPTFMSSLPFREPCPLHS